MGVPFDSAHPAPLWLASLPWLLVATAIVVKGEVARWRERWGWGRAGAIPITRTGHRGIALCVLLIGGGLLGFGGEFAFLLPLAGFCIFLLAGLHDSWRATKQRR